jgi:hypothetical protein
MDQKAAIADRLKQANNILVTVSNNPSVDQLASCIGLTLALNKIGKHATAVFSGQVPSTLEFLQPEKTIEKNTDSLRDFIIALDKAKADKLRYKVEDKVVKIFITPYRTSISERDLDFSQGDFNVDVVIALGVHNQQDLDIAITSHGRILHDATVATINVKPGGELGTINWLDTNASSLSELVVQLLDVVDHQLMDGQMATALLTGIVAETKRFSNDRTTPTTMSISAELMSAGANQQLVATKLEQPAPPPPPPPPAAEKHESENHENDEPHVSDDGTLEITHGEERQQKPEEPEHEPEHEEPKEEENPLQQIHIDEHGSLHTLEDQQEAAQKEQGSIDPTQHMESGRMILEPPRMGADFMNEASTPDETDYPSGNPLSLPTPAGSMLDGPAAFAPPVSATTTANPGPAFMPSALPPAQPAPIAPAPQVAQSSAPFPAPASQPEPIAPPAPALTPPAPVFPQSPLMPPAPAPIPAPAPTFPTPAPAPAPSIPAPNPPAPSAFTPPTTPPPTETLSQLEQEVHSPHVSPPSTPAPADNSGLGQFSPLGSEPLLPGAPSQPLTPPAPAPAPFEPPVEPPASAPTESSDPVSPDLASARDAVMQAIASQPATPSGTMEPIQALNAQPLGAPLHNPADDNAADTSIPGTLPSGPSIIQPTTPPAGPGAMPPPGPPPMMPPM